MAEALEPLEAVGILIPACNEEESIVACLEAVLASARQALLRHPGVRIAIVCAADSCTDSTAELARAVAQTSGGLVEVVVVGFRNVGRTRGAAAESVLEMLGESARVPERVWMATTDADSRVPLGWVEGQIDAALRGLDCLVGTVEPDPGSGAVELLDEWWRRHTLEEGHPYIFGANLGFRLSAYRAVGGFGERRFGEDVALVGALRNAGLSVESTDRHRVATSARLHGRVEDGLSTYLHALTAE